MNLNIPSHNLPVQDFTVTLTPDNFVVNYRDDLILTDGAVLASNKHIGNYTANYIALSTIKSGVLNNRSDYDNSKISGIRDSINLQSKLKSIIFRLLEWNYNKQFVIDVYKNGRVVLKLPSLPAKGGFTTNQSYDKLLVEEH